MKFSRVGKHTIKCIISEDEIVELGYTLEEIMGNGERTQQFMNEIFDLAEQEFEVEFEMGVKTVRADFLPDHTLALTFSEHPSASGMMEHLKDIVNGLLSTIPTEKLEEMKNGIEQQNQNTKNQKAENQIADVVVFLRFEDLESVIRYAKQVKAVYTPKSRLYKFDGQYYLRLDLAGVEEQVILRMSMITDEYAKGILSQAQRRAYIEEHGELIIPEAVIEELGKI